MFWLVCWGKFFNYIFSLFEEPAANCGCQQPESSYRQLFI